MTDSFKFKRTESREEVYSVIQDFIVYVSNYRLSNEMTSVTIKQLRKLADKFLEENRATYTAASETRPYTIKPVE